LPQIPKKINNSVIKDARVHYAVLKIRAGDHLDRRLAAQRWFDGGGSLLRYRLPDPSGPNSVSGTALPPNFVPRRERQY
jgi:hypothetical protein